MLFLNKLPTIWAVKILKVHKPLIRLLLLLTQLPQLPQFVTPMKRLWLKSLSHALMKTTSCKKSFLAKMVLTIYFCQTPKNWCKKSLRNSQNTRKLAASASPSRAATSICLRSLLQLTLALLRASQWPQWKGSKSQVQSLPSSWQVPLMQESWLVPPSTCTKLSNWFNKVS